jgi:hypothetical protein
MKWFVTDAQLAALRLQAHHEVLATYGLRFDAELMRLRSDHESQLARITDPQGPFVTHLREEIDFWRHQFLIERQRADIALDQCRVTHQGIGPVSLPLRESPVTHTGTPADMFRDPELAAMGLADGLAP